MSDKTFQEEGSLLLPREQRAHRTASSLWRQGEASKKERQGGCSLGGVQEEQEVPVLPDCQRRAIPRARGVQGKFIAVQQATQRCSAEKTSAEGRTHCRQERLAAKAFILI